MKNIIVKGIYSGNGKILLETKKSFNWDIISNENPPELPAGSSIELIISFDNSEFISGKSGIVWATYDARQAEIIQSALLAQNISSEIKITVPDEQKIFLIKINNPADVNESIEFVWRSKTGLRLKPDWLYSEGETNKSFEQWLNGQ